CEANRAMGCPPTASVTAVAGPAADRARAYGLPAEVIDGNDVVVVAGAVARAADRARSGGGPTVLEARTYRHFGHSRTDPAKYRPEDEVRDWLARDPLAVSRARLLEQGVPESDVDAAERRAAAAVAEAVASAKAAPDADPAEA